jgi:hypothetical protein
MARLVNRRGVYQALARTMVSLLSLARLQSLRRDDFQACTAGKNAPAIKVSARCRDD